jgi:DNA-binding winged helix-turn-helix (wHTH) protein
LSDVRYLVPLRLKVGKDASGNEYLDKIEVFGESRRLRPKEKKFLLLLARTPGRRVSTVAIYDALYPDSEEEPVNSLKQLVADLRTTIADVWLSGYRRTQATSKKIKEEMQDRDEAERILGNRHEAEEIIEHKDGGYALMNARVEWIE